MNLDKLESIFSAKYKDLVDQNAGNDLIDDDFWIDYCDRHKIRIMHPEWVKECFNEESRGMVCIHSPENDWWLLVPKRLAEKALVLGYLP
ncbi:hypothetical protein EBZ39_09065 [bacterium]|nr:hypothetical protein [bacterium]